jgi:hypothetical protein
VRASKQASVTESAQPHVLPTTEGSRYNGLMARKKATTQKPRPTPPVGSLQEAYSHFTAVLENVEQQNRATIEAVVGAERRLTERGDLQFQKLESRIQNLELAVRMNSDAILKNSQDILKNSQDIRKNSDDIGKNSDDIGSLQREVKRIGAILGVDRDVNVVAALEARVSAIEDRLDMAPT